MASKGLTPKQERFVKEYLIDLNATQAAIRAGYSAKTAQEASSRLLSHVMVAAEVAKGQAKVADKLDLTAERVLKELSNIAFANVADFFEWGPEGLLVKDKEKLTAEQQAAIAEVFPRKNGGIGFKFHDKTPALEKIGKHLGMFIDRTDITSKGEALKAYITFDPEKDV